MTKGALWLRVESEWNRVYRFLVRARGSTHFYWLLFFKLDAIIFNWGHHERRSFFDEIASFIFNWWQHEREVFENIFVSQLSKQQMIIIDLATHQRHKTACLAITRPTKYLVSAARFSMTHSFVHNWISRFQKIALSRDEAPVAPHFLAWQIKLFGIWFLWCFSSSLSLSWRDVVIGFEKLCCRSHKIKCN